VSLDGFVITPRVTGHVWSSRYWGAHTDYQLVGGSQGNPGNIGDLLVLVAAAHLPGVAMWADGLTTIHNNGDTHPSTGVMVGTWWGTMPTLHFNQRTTFAYHAYWFAPGTYDPQGPVFAAFAREGFSGGSLSTIATPSFDPIGSGLPAYDAGLYAHGYAIASAFYRGGVEVTQGGPGTVWSVGDNGASQYSPDTSGLTMHSGGYAPTGEPIAPPGMRGVEGNRQTVSVLAWVQPLTRPRAIDFAWWQEGEVSRFRGNADENPAAFRFEAGGVGVDGADVSLIVPAGTSSARFLVTNAAGASDVTLPIGPVVGPVVTGITATQEGDQVRFRATTNGQPVTSWRWAFGDGSTSSEGPNPALRTVEAGTYIVSLTVENRTGEQTGSVQYTVLGPDVQDITTSQEGSVVTFGATVANAHNLTWAWDFGNGQTSSVAAPRLAMAPGTYTVTLTVTNRAGSDTYSEQVTVRVEAPVASFRWSRIPGELSVIFTDTSLRVASRSWTVTRAGVTVATSSAAEWTHTFTEEGTYQVTLQVTNATGTSSAAQTVTLSLDWTAHEVAGRVVSLFAKARDGRTADITCDITAISWDYGTTTDDGLMTVPDATRLLVRFRDPDGELDPLRGPLRDIVCVGSEVTYMLGVHGDVRVALHGLVQDVAHQGGVSTLLVFDAIGVLAQAAIPTDAPGVRLAESAQARMDGILDLAGWPTGRRAYLGMDGVAQPVAAADLRGTNAWAALVDLATQTGAMLWVTPDGVVTMHDRAAGLTAQGGAQVKRWRRPQVTPMPTGPGVWQVATTELEPRPVALTVGCDPDPVVSDFRTVSGADDLVNVLVTEAGDQALTTTAQASVDAHARRDAKYSLDLVPDADRQLLWNLQHAWAMADPKPHVGVAALRVAPEQTPALLGLEPFDYVRVRIPPQGIDQTLRVVGMRWTMDHEGADCTLTFMGEPPSGYIAPDLTHTTTEAGGAGGIGGSVGGAGGGVVTGGSAAPGLIAPFAGSAVPEGWLLCDGRSVSRADYAALFAAIGTTYGSSDGATFKVPDLRGRSIFGVGAAPFDALGKTGGATTHQHGGVGDHAHAAGGLTANPNGEWTNVPGEPVTSVASYNHSHSIGGATASTGGHQHGAQTAIPPYMALQYIIRAA
jgi:PKD repeat protein